MRFFRLLLWCILLPAFAMAQSGSITGKVTIKDSKTTVPQASVFLSNSSFGTISGNDGTYALYKLRPGQYTLVVTGVGYEDFVKKVQVEDGPIEVNIELIPKTIQLREVTISTNSKADWKRNFEQFKKEFIGTDENAKLCQILNPDVLYFTYSKRKLLLEAETDKFLVIENRGLGYRVKVLLQSFKSDGIADRIGVEEQRLFEELPGSKEQKKIWAKKRDIAYYGSAMHFYRSLYTDKLKEEGFELHKLTRYPNPARPSDEVIRQKINRFKSINRPDSANHWIEINNLSRYYQESITHIPWFSYELLRNTPTPGIYAITFPNYLYVIYTKKRDEIDYRDIYRPLDLPNYEITVVTLPDKAQYYLFDKNGVVVNDPPLYEGTWATKGTLSQLLPVDYVPTQSFEDTQLK